MEESIGTGKDNGKQTAGEADVSIDDHPLFMTRVPSPNDFKNNELLSALAALIDEDEDEQNPGPHRRQRRKVRSAPWTSSNALKSVAPSDNPRHMICCRVPQQAASDVFDPGRPRRVPAENENEKGPVDHLPHSSGMQREVDLPEETPLPSEEQKPSSSLGELQICMRLFSIK